MEDHQTCAEQERRTLNGDDDNAVQEVFITKTHRYRAWKL